MAHISNSKYTQKKSTASLWKSELKKILIDKFDNNFLKLQIALQDAGIQRSEATLKNWTNDTSIVAPQHFEQTIIKLSTIDDISENFKQQKNEVIAAIDFCYSCRRESSKVLLNSLTSDAEYDDFNKEIRVNLLGEQFKFDVVQITTVGSQISVSSEELWKIKAVD